MNNISNINQSSDGFQISSQGIRLDQPCSDDEEFGVQYSNGGKPLHFEPCGEFNEKYGPHVNRNATTLQNHSQYFAGPCDPIVPYKNKIGPCTNSDRPDYDIEPGCSQKEPCTRNDIWPPQPCLEDPRKEPKKPYDDIDPRYRLSPPDYDIDPGFHQNFEPSYGNEYLGPLSCSEDSKKESPSKTDREDRERDRDFEAGRDKDNDYPEQQEKNEIDPELLPGSRQMRIGTEKK